MKNIFKLIRGFKSSKEKESDFSLILKKSKEVGLPIYTVIRLLKSMERKVSKIHGVEGWVLKDAEIETKKIKDEKGTILKDSLVVNVFKDEGWKWGGNWKRTKDYQHFYK